MRLMYREYGIDLEIKENRVNVLVIEPPNIFSLIMEELTNQMRGEPGGLILSEQDVIKNFCREAEMVVNPFEVDCNEKRILQKLYQELTQEMNDFLIEKTVCLQGQIIAYLDELLQRVPYSLDYEIEENMAGLLKLCHVEIDNQGETLVEKLMSYIRALKQFCNIQVIFFVNLKLFLTQPELEELYKFASYEKISLILLENSFKEKLKNESICILDKDLCIISVE